MAADAVATFDRPDPVGELSSRGEHLRIAGVVGAVSAGGQNLRGRVEGFDRGRAFVWVRSDGDGHCRAARVAETSWCPCGRAPLVRAMGQAPT